MQSSLRWRLTLTFTALAIVAVLIHSLSLFLNVEDQEEIVIDDVVRATMRQEAAQPSRPLEYDRLQVLSPRLLLFRSRSGSVPPVLPAAFAQYKAGTYEWIRDDTEYHVGVRDLPGERMYILYDARDHEWRMRRLLWAIGVSVLILSLLSLLIGHWLAGRVLHQLADLIDRLRDDEARLAEPGLDREIEQLAQRLDHYRQRNRELLRHEQDFTANVSHELRTPLTRIRTAAELLAEEAPVGSRAAARAQGIITAVDELEANLRSLLFLAREIQPARPQPLPLADCVDQSLARLAGDFDVTRVELVNAVPPDMSVHADPTLLRLLLDNVLRNAARHTQQGCIRIVCANSVLEIADTGAGIAPEHLHRVFERAYRVDNGSSGQGLGLAIVQRICQAHGWTCSIASNADPHDPQRGTQVRIDFAPAAPGAATH